MGKKLNLIFALLLGVVMILGGLFALNSRILPGPARIVPFVQNISPPLDLQDTSKEIHKAAIAGISILAFGPILFGIMLFLDSKRAYRTEPPIEPSKTPYVPEARQGIPNRKEVPPPPMVKPRR